MSCTLGRLDCAVCVQIEKIVELASSKVELP